MMAEFDWFTFPTLITPRLVLRQVVLGDAADIFSMHGDPEVQKYDSDPPLRDIAEAAAMIVKNEQRFASKQAINWGIVLKDENRVVGGLGFYFWERAYYKTDLGYSIARAYWQRGIATEAVRAAMQFGFKTLHLHRINVDTRIDNIASMRLMDKLGFHTEGVRRECIRNEDGSYQSWALFGMLENEYHLV